MAISDVKPTSLPDNVNAVNQQDSKKSDFETVVKNEAVNKVTQETAVQNETASKVTQETAVKNETDFKVTQETVLNNKTETVRLEEKNVTSVKDAQKQTKILNEKTEEEGNIRTNPEGVNFEFLAEMNPENRIQDSENREGIQGIENFQIEQINKLNAEISKSTARRSFVSTPPGTLQQDNQLGGKINTVV